MAVVKHYRHTETGDVYTFRFVKNSGEWVIYCTQHPPNTHRWGSVAHIFEDGRLCITAGQEPKTFEQAVARAFTWLNGYSQYIRTGEFPNIACRARVPDYDESGNRTDQ